MLNLIVVFNIFWHDTTRFDVKGKVHDRSHLLKQPIVAAFLQLKLDWEITAIDALLQALYVPTNVGVARDKLAFVVALAVFDLFIGEDDVAAIGLGHEEQLAQHARASAEHFIRVSWDDRAEREDEVMDHLHVEEVRGDGVRD